MLVDDSRLYALGDKRSLGSYLQEVWQRRHFVIADARSRANQTGRGMILGRLWVIIKPLMDAALYGLIFGLLLDTSRGVENFVGFLVLGVIFFSFLSKSLTSGSGLVKASKNLIAAFHFPRASLVLGRSLRLFLDHIPPALVAVFVALALQIPKVSPGPLVLIVPLYVLMHIFGCGLMLIVARLTAFFPDAKHLVGFFNRAWFYGSGIFYSVETFATNWLIYNAMSANPAYQFLTAVRTVVLDGNVPDLATWLSLSAWSIGTFVVGFIYFWRAESRYQHVE